MAYSLQLPNGTYVDGIPDNVPQAQALAALKQKYPQAFGRTSSWNESPLDLPSAAPAAAAPKRGGYMGSLAKGTEGLLSSTQTGLEAVFGDPAEAAKAGLARDKTLEGKYAQETGLAIIAEKYRTEGIAAAAKEVVRQFPHVLAEQAPNIALTIAGAKAGALTGAALTGANPIGAAVGAAVGGAGALLPQYIGSNVERQAQAQQQAGQAVDPHVGVAAATGVAQGALDFLSLKMLGGKVLGKFLGMPGETTEQALKVAAERSLKASAGVGAGKGLAEIPTEVAQQILERAQAGLPLANDEALAEYGDAAYQAGLVGPALGGVSGIADRARARGQIADKERADAVAADTAAREAEAARKASPEYLNSVEGMTEAKGALKKQAAELRKQIGSLRDKDDTLQQEEKAALSEQHKGLLAQINDLNARIKDAKKSPEQRFVEMVTTPPVEEPSRRAPVAVTDPGVVKWEEDTREQMKAAGKKPAEIDAYISQSRRLRGLPAEQPQASGMEFDYQTSGVTDTALLALTNPREYKMWLDQAQRERDAGQLPRMGEAGMLPQPVENMAPVVGPNGTVVGYRPIGPEEGIARPQFELGQQMPAMQQQGFDLGEPPRGPAPSLRLPVRKFGAPVPPAPSTAAPGRVTTNFASAAPVTPAGVREQDRWRIAIPGQAVSPRGEEAIPPDAVAPPEPPPGQQPLPLGGTEDALAKAVLAQPGQIIEGLTPARASGNVMRHRIEADAKVQGKAAYAELLDTLAQLRRGDTRAGQRGKYGLVARDFKRRAELREQAKQREAQGLPPYTPEEQAELQEIDTAEQEAISARSVTRKPNRPELTTPVKRAALLEKLKLLRSRIVRQALREVVEKRAQMGLRPLTREEAAGKLAQIDGLVRELSMRALAAQRPTKKPNQRFVFNKGAIRTPEQAKNVQDAIVRLRGEMADLYSRIVGERHKFTDWAELEAQADALIEREAGLSEKLRKYMAGDVGKTVVRPWSGAKNDNSSAAIERPFGNFKAASEAIYEQIERVKDSMLQTTRGPVSRQGEGFQLGKQYLDPKLAPTPEPVEESFEDAALEAEVTGRQETLPTFAPRGASKELMQMYQKHLRDAVAAVRKAVADGATSANTTKAGNEDVQALIEESRLVKAKMDALSTKLNDGYADLAKLFDQMEEFTRTEDAQNLINAIKMRGSADIAADLKLFGNRRKLNKSQREAVSNMVEEERAIGTFTTGKTLGQYMMSRQVGKFKEGKRPLTFERLREQVEQMLTDYANAKGEFAELIGRIERSKERRKENRRMVDKQLEVLRGRLKDSAQKAETAVTKHETLIRKRFDLPVLPPREAPRPNRLFQPISPEDRKLRARQTAGSDPAIARLAAEGFREPTRSRFAGEKALRNAAVQQRAFEEQTGQQGLFAEKAKKAKASKRRNPDAILPQAEDFAPDEFIPDGFGGDFDAATRFGEREGPTIAVEEAAALAAQAQQVIPNLVYFPNLGSVTVGFAKRISDELGIFDFEDLKGGVLKDGTPFVIGDAHTDAADFNATVQHEYVGHYKMDRVMFGTRNGFALMKELSGKYLQTPEASVALMRELGFSDATIEQVGNDTLLAQASGRDPALTTLREIVARVSEIKPGTLGEKAKRFFKEFIGAVRYAMRELGFDLDKLTDNDVFFMLKRAERGQVLTKGETEGAARQTVRTPADLQAVAKRAYPAPEGRLGTLTRNGWGMLFRTQFVDRFDPFVRVAREMLDSVKASQMLYYLRMTDRVNQLVAEAMTHGPVALTHAKDGKGRLYQSMKGANIHDLIQTLKGEDFKTWALYLALERAQSINGGLEKLFGDAAPRVSPEEQARILAYGRNNPAFQAARKMYREYNAALVKLLLDTGTITEKAAKDWVTRDYIPFYRKDDLGNIEMMGDHPIKIGNIRDQKDIAHLIGSDRALDDPMANIARNTRILIGSAVRNQAAKNTAYELRALGLGEATKGDMRNEFGRNVIHFKDKGDDRSFVIKTENNPKFADIPGDIMAKGMEGVATQLPSVLKLLQIPTKFLRDAITLNPLYMVRQLTRDPLHAWLSTGMDTKAMLNAYKRVGNLMLHRDETGELLRERGLIGGQLIQGTDEDMARIMSQIHAGQNVTSQMITWLHDKGVAADATTRAALYDNFRKRGLSELEATMATMDSINFASRGMSSGMQMANMLIPFFNAQIQGLDSVWRSLSGQMPFNERVQARQKLVQRAALLAAGTVMYYAMVQDEDWYQNTPENVRLMNWLFKIPGVDEPIRIPRPFEFGMMFVAVPESILMASKGDPEADAVFKALKNQALNQIPGGSSFLIPSAVKPLIEGATNHSFFTGQKIVPSGLEDAAPEEQWTPNTTETAKQVGKALGVSPMIVENFIKGYAAALGYSTLQLLDSALSNTSVPKPEKPLSRTAIVGPAFQQTDGSAIITRAYEQADRFEAANKRFKAAQTQGRVADAQEVLTEQPRELMLAKPAGRFKQQMGDLTRMEKQVHFAPNMSPAEKTAMLKQLRQRKIELARQFEDSVR